MIGFVLLIFVFALASASTVGDCVALGGNCIDATVNACIGSVQPRYCAGGSAASVVCCVPSTAAAADVVLAANGKRQDIGQIIGNILGVVNAVNNVANAVNGVNNAANMASSVANAANNAASSIKAALPTALPTLPTLPPVNAQDVINSLISANAAASTTRKPTTTAAPTKPTTKTTKAPTTQNTLLETVNAYAPTIGGFDDFANRQNQITTPDDADAEGAAHKNEKSHAADNNTITIVGALLGAIGFLVCVGVIGFCVVRGSSLTHGANSNDAYSARNPVYTSQHPNQQQHQPQPNPMFSARSERMGGPNGGEIAMSQFHPNSGGSLMHNATGPISASNPAFTPGFSGRQEQSFNPAMSARSDVNAAFNGATTQNNWQQHATGQVATPNSFARGIGGANSGGTMQIGTFQTVGLAGGAGAFKCSLCGKSYNYADDLRQHNELRHAAGGETVQLQRPALANTQQQAW